VPYCRGFKFSDDCGDVATALSIFEERDKKKTFLLLLHKDAVL